MDMLVRCFRLAAATAVSLRRSVNLVVQPELPPNPIPATRVLPPPDTPGVHVPELPS
jgi:hypothetical protein